jgi:hypothetical protein
VPGRRKRRARAAHRRAAGRTAHAEIIGQGIDYEQRTYASFERLSLPAPSIEVDTADGYEPALEEIVAFVNRTS